MKNKFYSSLLGLAAGVLLGVVTPQGMAAAAPQTVSFRMGPACRCTRCAADGQRALAKFEGVQKVALSVKDQRLEIVFEESKRPLSALAVAVTRLEMGRGASLVWPVAPGGDLKEAAGEIGRIPGIKSAKPDAKASAVLLAFSNEPTVTIAQLDAALKGLPAGEKP